MTKKDYEFIAWVLSKCQDNDANDMVTLNRVTNEFAKYLALKHPRFNTGTFIRACGFQVGVEPEGNI